MCVQKICTINVECIKYNQQGAGQRAAESFLRPVCLQSSCLPPCFTPRVKDEGSKWESSPTLEPFKAPAQVWPEETFHPNPYQHSVR